MYAVLIMTLAGEKNNILWQLNFAEWGLGKMLLPRNRCAYLEDITFCPMKWVPTAVTLGCSSVAVWKPGYRAVMQIQMHFSLKIGIKYLQFRYVEVVVIRVQIVLSTYQVSKADGKGCTINVGVVWLIE